MQLMFYKPEWYFAHIQNVSHEHRPFMDDIIQRLLKKSEYGNISAWVSLVDYSFREDSILTVMFSENLQNCYSLSYRESYGELCPCC